MKKTKLFAAIAITTSAIGLIGATICLIRKSREEKRRLAAISDAGYELAYDIHDSPYARKYSR